MLSIGELAHGTGTSRRMLRHWEQEGLLAPAVVDPVTGYRHYDEAQRDRVRAITELRSLGFGLADIARLLDPGTSGTSLRGLLEAQATALRDEISEASTRLDRVQHRLDLLRTTAQEIAMNTSLTALPALALRGASTTVVDETEIGTAVARLREQLPVSDVVAMLYDGTRDDRITVHVGIPADDALAAVATPAVQHGASVTLDAPPDSIVDAWVLLDDELARRGLVTFGVYRHLVDADGTTTLQAPVRPLS